MALLTFFSNRFRIDNVPEVTIKEIFLRPDDIVDFWFSGIHLNLTLTGEIKCPSCLTQELQLSNLTAYKKPQINLHIIKSGSVMLDNFVKESEVSSERSRFSHSNKHAQRIFLISCRTF